MISNDEYKPNFEKSYKLANDILVSSQVINSFPFSAKKLINEISDMKCVNFKKVKEYNVDIEAFGSESAVLIQQQNCKIIFYNEKEYKPRIRYSILHEGGHDKLKHAKDVTDRDLYQKQEVETNFFAAQLLMPEQLIREFQKRGKRIDINFLIETFGVSKQAAEKRIRTLNKNLNLTQEEKIYDDLIVEKYRVWLNSKIPEVNEINMFYDDEEKQRERENWSYNY